MSGIDDLTKQNNVSPSQTGKASVPRSRLSVIHDVTVETVEAMSQSEREDAPYVESSVLNAVHAAIDIYNAVVPKGEQKWKHLSKLMPSQIADILIRSYPIVRIAGAGKGVDEDQDLIGLYQKDGPDEGTYVVSNVAFRRLMRKYDYSLTVKDSEEVMSAMLEQLPRVEQCSDKDLVAVNNGIFNYATKRLMPFDPSYVFLTKSHVDYDPNAVNPVIHNDDDGTDWDVESWMKELSDDPEIVDLLWEILGAIVRPLAPWNKSAWFYSETGNNGKGTLCELMRQLCGEGAYASIPLSDFGKDFMLEPLIRASAVIVDENDVGTFIDKAANLKAIITNDVIQINRKFKTPVAFQFKGFMVQCLNEFPKIRDRSDSLYRRQLFIPFTKCFTGQERRYIKSDYMHRPEVLRYVLHRVLNMNYESLSEPDACRIALEEYKEYNDPIRQFLDEFMARFTWDLLPYEFLYDLYKAWHKDTAGSGSVLKGRTSFMQDIRALVQAEYDEWIVNSVPIRSKGKMEDPEPLIAEYDLDKWMNPLYKGSDRNKICLPALSSTYRGLTRKAALKAPRGSGFGPEPVRGEVVDDDEEE